MFPNETGCGVRGCAGVWDRNAIKLGCDDHCATINIIKFIKNNFKMMWYFCLYCTE